MLPINPAVADPLRALLLSNPQLAFSSAQPDLSAQPFSPEQGPAPGSGLAQLAAMTQQSPPMPQLAPGPTALPSQAAMQPPEANIPDLGPDATALAGDIYAPEGSDFGADTETVGSPATDPTAYAPLGGGAMAPPPTPPTAPTDADLYPSRKAALWEAAIPAMGAIVAALLGGGKAGATGALLGGQQGFQQVNADKRERGLTDYSLKQQQYAREVALYNQHWQQAKERASQVEGLSQWASQFDDPNVAWQGLQARKAYYAQQGINVDDAMPGGPTGALSLQKVRAQAKAAYEGGIAAVQKLAPDTPIDFDKVKVRLGGKLVTLAEAAAVAGLPVVSQDAQLSSTKLGPEAIAKTRIAAFETDHGRLPDATERAGIYLHAAQEWAAASAKPTDPLDAEIKRKRLALMTGQIAKLSAGASDETAYSPAQRQFSEKVNGDYRTASSSFNRLGQAVDAVQAAAASGEDDLGLVQGVLSMVAPNDPSAKELQALGAKLAADPNMTLTDAQRTALANRAQRIYEGAAAGQKQLFDTASQQLRDKGITPADVLTPQGSMTDNSVYRTVEPSDQDRESQAFKGLSPGDVEVVKMIAQYTYPIGTRPSEKVLKLIGRAAILKGGPLDLGQYQIRQRTRLAFTTGKPAENAKSIRTAIHHLASLKEKADALGNTWSDTYNSVGNWLLNRKGDARVNNFEQAALAVQTELANAFKGGSATDPEINHWLDKVHSADSPEKLRGAISTAVELLSGRAEALREQYETGMGEAGTFSLIDAPERKILSQFGIDPRKFDPGDNPAGQVLGAPPRRAPRTTGTIPTPAEVRAGAAPPTPRAASPSVAPGRKSPPPVVGSTVLKDGKLKVVAEVNPVTGNVRLEDPKTPTYQVQGTNPDGTPKIGLAPDFRQPQ